MLESGRPMSAKKIKGSRVVFDFNNDSRPFRSSTFNGQTTAAIGYNATAAAVQTALQGLSSIGSGNALVAGGSGAPWQVRFAGTLGGSVQPALAGNGSGLTGGTSPSVALTVTSLGGDAGRVQQTTDPRGISTKTNYDWDRRFQFILGRWSGEK